MDARRYFVCNANSGGIGDTHSGSVDSQLGLIRMKAKHVVILDVDGVLAKHGQPVSSEVSGLVRKISQRSLIALASGKPASYLEGLSRGIGLSKVIIIGENGGVIDFPEKREEIVFSDIYPEVTKNLGILATELNKRLKGKCWFQPNKVTVTAFPKFDFTIKDTLKHFEGIIAERRLKGIRLFAHVDAVDEVPEQLDKGWSLDILSDILNIGKSDFISVGDSDTDIPMLSKTGLSICVGNNPNLKKVAHKTFATGVEALNYILEII
jgi:HAD superfamily hydrolase (TIGR01484 family)